MIGHATHSAHLPVPAVTAHGAAGQLRHAVHAPPVGGVAALVVAPRVQDVLPVAVVGHEQLQGGQHWCNQFAS